MTNEKMTAWESAAAEFGQKEVDELVREGVSFYLIRKMTNRCTCWGWKEKEQKPYWPEDSAPVRSPIC